MKCYQITQHGECVAIVHEIGMARAIVECRPRGCYAVQEIEIGRPASRRKKPARRPSSIHPVAPRRRKSGKQPGRSVFGATIGTIGQSRLHAR
jgi:hypothetical protein